MRSCAWGHTKVTQLRGLNARHAQPHCSAGAPWPLRWPPRRAVSIDQCDPVLRRWRLLSPTYVRHERGSVLQHTWETSSCQHEPHSCSLRVRPQHAATTGGPRGAASAALAAALQGSAPSGTARASARFRSDRMTARGSCTAAWGRSSDESTC